jgi:hypothetical protein
VYLTPEENERCSGLCRKPKTQIPNSHKTPCRPNTVPRRNGHITQMSSLNSVPKCRRNNTGNVRINITMKCVRVTIVAVEKQQAAHILSACL